MPSFALDTNCILAAVSAWHPHHRAAAAEIKRRFDHGERLVTLAPSLVEAYSVLTRMPAPQRLSSADAWTLLDKNFVERRELAAVSASTCIVTLREIAQAEIGGGRTYDALIAACAVDAKVATLLTFNRRHFDPPLPGLAIVEPRP